MATDSMLSWSESSGATTKGKMIRFHMSDVSSQGRNTWGVRIIDLEADDRVGSVARVESESTAPVEAQ